MQRLLFLILAYAMTPQLHAGESCGEHFTTPAIHGEHGFMGLDPNNRMPILGPPRPDFSNLGLLEPGSGSPNTDMISDSRGGRITAFEAQIQAHQRRKP